MTQSNFEQKHLGSEELDIFIQKDAKKELSPDELLAVSENDAEAILSARNTRKLLRSHGAL